MINKKAVRRYADALRSAGELVEAQRAELVRGRRRWRVCRRRLAGVVAAECWRRRDDAFWSANVGRFFAAAAAAAARRTATTATHFFR